MGCGRSAAKQNAERGEGSRFVDETSRGAAASETIVIERSDHEAQLHRHFLAPMIGKACGFAVQPALSSNIKNAQVRNFILSSLTKNGIFMAEMNLRGVEEDAVHDLISSMYIEKYPKNDVLIVGQGDADHDCLYIISRGVFLLFDGNQQIGTVEAGTVVGDTWFFGQSPAEYTIRAKRGSECYVLPMQRFLSVVGKETLYSQIDVLDGLSDEQLYRFKSMIAVEVYRKDEVIFNKGDPGLAFYIILSGLVELKVGAPDYDMPRVRKEHDSILGLGGWFGEESLILGGPQPNTAIAAGVTTLCKVPSEVFNDPEIFGPVRQRLQKLVDLTRVSEHSHHASRKFPLIVRKNVGFGVEGLVSWTSSALYSISSKHTSDQYIAGIIPSKSDLTSSKRETNNSQHVRLGPDSLVREGTPDINLGQKNEPLSARVEASRIEVLNALMGSPEENILPSASQEENVVHSNDLSIELLANRIESELASSEADDNTSVDRLTPHIVHGQQQDEDYSDGDPSDYVDVKRDRPTLCIEERANTEFMIEVDSSSDEGIAPFVHNPEAEFQGGLVDTNVSSISSNGGNGIYDGNGTMTSGNDSDSDMLGHIVNPYKSNTPVRGDAIVNPYKSSTSVRGDASVNTDRSVSVESDDDLEIEGTLAHVPNTKMSNAFIVEQ